MRVAAVLLCALLGAGIALAQAPDAGRRQFETLCASCHGGDGNGGERGPAIVTRLALRRDDELAAFIRDGLPGAGMPGFPLADPDMRPLIAFLRTLRPKEGSAPPRISVKTTDGRTLEGVALNQSSFDLQLLSDDRRVHLLRKSGERYRPVTSQADWPTYHGRLDGNRYSALAQIDKANVARLAPRWTTGIRTTARRRRLWPWAGSSSPARRGATKALAASWPPSIRRRARRCGASGRCPSAASRDRRRGRARTSSMAAPRRGSPGR